MPVPWDAVVPCGIILGFFTILGQAQYQGARFANEGKNPRMKHDDWIDMMMGRDRKLTNTYRQQRTDAEAPPEFHSVDSQSTLWRMQ